MKRYKLKKDLPTFKAGDEFYLDSNNDLRLKGSDIMAYNHHNLEKFPNILKDWFEEISGYERRRARQSNVYWFIDDVGDEKYEIETGHTIDDFRWMLSNYFKNKKEAKAYKKYLLARQVLLDDAKGGKFIVGGNNYCDYYDHVFNSWEHCVDRNEDRQYLGSIYFQSEDDLEESLKKHKDQWEIVRKYEMGEM